MDDDSQIDDSLIRLCMILLDGTKTVQMSDKCSPKCEKQLKYIGGLMGLKFCEQTFHTHSAVSLICTAAAGVSADGSIPQVIQVYGCTVQSSDTPPSAGSSFPPENCVGLM